MNHRKLTIKEVQAIMLDMIKQISIFLDELNVPWFVSDGTLLGAVRNNGFIPWDDDADIWVPWEHYGEIIKHSDYFKPPLFFRNELTERDWLTTGFKHGQVHNMTTTGIYPTKRVTKGVFIDIFPIIDNGNGMVINKYLPSSCNEVAKEWTLKTEKHVFEDTIVNIPVEYDKILTKQYGDWRTPKHIKSTHGDMTFLDIPYDDYIKLHY